jgi:hypothetical protein
VADQCGSCWSGYFENSTVGTCVACRTAANSACSLLGLRCQGDECSTSCLDGYTAANGSAVGTCVPDCSKATPELCALLHRGECRLDNTCGACVAGYLPVSGRLRCEANCSGFEPAVCAGAKRQANPPLADET